MNFQNNYFRSLATMIFDRHTKSVFCSKPSPNGDLFGSGGEDDRGFIFDRQGELYMALFGHKGI